MAIILNLFDNSRVTFVPFSWRTEGEHYIVWRKEGSNFIELAEDSFITLQLLQQGESFREVSERLEKKYGEKYDIKDFVSELIQLGFVSSIDGIPLQVTPPRGKTISFINPRYARWIYSTPLLMVYIGLIVFAGMIFLSNREYLPKYSDFFFHENYLVVLSMSLFMGVILLIFHEFAHLMAGKAVGVDGFFRISMRLYFIVAETNLTRLWSVPRKKRYLPFLAGMLNDGFIIAILTIHRWASDQGLVSRIAFVYAFEKLIILILFYGIIWQFFFFMRTDLYYVIANLLGCRNLFGDSWTLILNNLFLAFFRNLKIPLSIPRKELRIAKIYAPFMLITTVLSLGFFAVYGLPILIQLLLQAINMLMINSQVDLSTFLEGLILTVMMSLQIFGFVYFIVRTIFGFKQKISSRYNSKELE